nr:immunoglobulin heavy chain junction region [Macaca mulatta]MOV49153.1 immunoglobulin heavy chain junction region [Macaca mulatta]MOV49167.1 immunoglobulin heavy chain junction region [Macaca mulatta]MOV49609.1 immunoglobulin heavy chain junction region [Macaca mulatta]MOV50187.1 immunoglobulin heavy chain junction region [Macaca mulatta]
CAREIWASGWEKFDYW